MKSLIFCYTFILCFFVSIQAQSTDLTFKDPTIRFNTNATVAAGYTTITNNTDNPVSLIVEKATGFKAVELHQSFEKKGHMWMEKVNSVTLQAKSSFVLKPGGHHIMLFDPEKSFKDGDIITISFRRDGKSMQEKFKITVPTAGHNHSHH